MPAVGCSKPAIIRSVVVLPQPDGPEERHELALLHREVEVLDGDGAAREPLLDAGQGQVAHAAVVSVVIMAQWAPVTSISVWLPRPMSAITPIASPGDREADEGDGRGLVGEVARDQLQVRGEHRAGRGSSRW